MESLVTAVKFSHIKALEEVKAKLGPDQRKRLKVMLMMGPTADRMAYERQEAH